MDELLIAPTATIEDLAGREGFDENFLGQPVPLPALAGADTVLLPYTHFSVLVRLEKRLAAVTGVGIDGAKLLDLDRAGINWRLDPRLREDQQTGERVYAGNDIDRGHLVRRASAVWGDTRAEAAQANADTFHYSNAAPQAAGFNQGLELWLGRSPTFKVAVFIREGELAATGYVVDQIPQMADLPDVPRPGAIDDVPPLGPFRTFQTRIRDIAELTGLDLDQLAEVDRMPIAATLGTAPVGSTWRELGALEDLDLDFDLED